MKTFEEIVEFFRSKERFDCYPHDLRFNREFMPPDKIPIVGSTDNGKDSEGTEIYQEVLLPKFIEFTEGEGFDLLNYDKRQSKNNFSDLYEKSIKEFNENLSPLVFRDNIYFLRIKSKKLTGLPKDAMSHLELKELFNYEYYRVNEQSFFKIITAYNNLYEFNAKRAKTMPLIAIIIMLLVIILILLTIKI